MKNTAFCELLRKHEKFGSDNVLDKLSDLVDLVKLHDLV